MGKIKMIKFQLSGNCSEYKIGFYIEEIFMCEEIKIREERISSVEYINFVKRTDLGSQ